MFGSLRWMLMLDAYISAVSLYASDIFLSNLVRDIKSSCCFLVDIISAAAEEVATTYLSYRTSKLNVYPIVRDIYT
jgi:hypothetical protein